LAEFVLVKIIAEAALRTLFNNFFVYLSFKVKVNINLSEFRLVCTDILLFGFLLSVVNGGGVIKSFDTCPGRLFPIIVRVALNTKLRLGKFQYSA